MKISSPSELRLFGYLPPHLGKEPVLGTIQLPNSITLDPFRQTQLYLTFSGPTQLCFKLSTLNLIVLKICYMPPFRCRHISKGDTLRDLEDWCQERWFAILSVSLLLLPFPNDVGWGCSPDPLCELYPTMHDSMVDLLSKISELVGGPSEVA